MKSQLLKQLLTLKTYVLLFTFVLSVSFVNAQRCDSTIAVENNFNSRPIDRVGTSFILVITNNSSEDYEYSLSTEFTRCDELMIDETNSSFRNRLPIDISFFENNNSLRSNRIRVAGNSSKKIILKAKTTSPIPAETISCVKVFANNSACEANSVFTNIQLLVFGKGKNDH